MSYDLIIIGGGIAGSAAALRAAQNHLKVAWVLGDKTTAKRSRGLWVANIDNMVGIHDGIVKEKLLKALKGERFQEAREVLQQLPPQPISTRDLIRNTQQRIQEEFSDFVDEYGKVADSVEREGENGPFRVRGKDLDLSAPFMILATGVMDRQPIVRKTHKGEEVAQPNWVYPFANRESFLYCLRCEGHLTSGSKTAVIGHGESAAQLAMMLHERYESVCCVLTNGEAPAWKPESQRLLDQYGVGVHRQAIVDLQGRAGDLHAIVLEDGKEVPVSFALVSLGLYRVYNELACQLNAELADPGQPEDERHVLISHKGETSVPGLFSVGDMTKRQGEPVMKQVYTAQEYAVRAVDTIDSRLRAARRSAVLAESGQV